MHLFLRRRGGEVGHHRVRVHVHVDDGREGYLIFFGAVRLPFLLLLFPLFLLLFLMVQKKKMMRKESQEQSSKIAQTTDFHRGRNGNSGRSYWEQ